VAYGGAHAGLDVDVDGAEGGVVGAPAHHDQRHALGGGGHHVVGLEQVADQGVHLAGERSQQVRLACRVVLGAADDDLPALLFGGVDDAGDQLREERVHHVRHDQADRGRAGVDQATGEPRRPVAQLPGRVEDPAASRRVDLVLVVDGPGHGLMRDARQPRHVPECHAPGAVALFVAHDPGIVNRGR
jgi:hypothetical protein